MNSPLKSPKTRVVAVWYVLGILSTTTNDFLTPKNVHQSRCISSPQSLSKHLVELEKWVIAHHEW